MTAGVWDVIVPLKDLTRAKSRLSQDDDLRRALARAMAVDTVAAAAACPLRTRVRVVTDDLVLAAEVLRLGENILVHAGAPVGLNAAIEYGAAIARSQGPSRGTVVLLGDLPALRPEDLAVLLEQFAQLPRAVVADVAGTGSTMLAVVSGTLSSAFGAASFLRHLASGATCVEAPVRARRDVDTIEDLRHAWTMGVGPRTARVISNRRRSHALTVDSSSAATPPVCWCSRRPAQATRPAVCPAAADGAPCMGQSLETSSGDIRSALPGTGRVRRRSLERRLLAADPRPLLSPRDTSPPTSWTRFLRIAYP